MTIILIPKSDDDSDRQLPIFHEHTSDFDDWWCKSGFADVDKLIFFRRPKKRVRFDEAKNEIWTIDRYDDKENDKLIFFQPSKKRVRFDESANEIWTIDRYDDKENERSGLNIGFSDDGNFQSAEMKIMPSNDDEGSSSINPDIPVENEKVDSTCPHISCDEDTGRKILTRRKTILKAVKIFSRRLREKNCERLFQAFFLLSWTAKKMLSAYFPRDVQYPKRLI